MYYIYGNIRAIPTYRVGMNICFSDPAGSHFAEFQKKKEKKGCGQVLANIDEAHAHKCCPT